MIGVKINKGGYQDNCASYVFEKTFNTTKNKIIIKSPTGSGKTVILNDVIERIINIKNQYSFVWLTPGKGDLEEQSKKSIEEKSPQIKTKNLWETINDGFSVGDVTFINWELLTKTGNKALRVTERKSLFDQIIIAHKKGIEFIVIIDEEHSNDTQKAKDVIDAFSAWKEIRVSATARFTNESFNYEIHEEDVINEQFITKGIYINYDLNDGEIGGTNEYIKLIEHGISKRTEIQNEYRNLPYNFNVNPLMIIQFPNQSQSFINIVEDYLMREKGITYENGLLAIWMADSKDKKNIDNLSNNEDKVQVLLMKQAISTGWDCKRAKILVKLRENMNEDFEIQTIGRIRRMPHLKHFNNKLLDYCFLYTLDDNYVSGLKSGTKYIFSEKVLSLKEPYKDITFVKENKDDDINEINERDVLESLFAFFDNKYKKDNDYRVKMQEQGYNFEKTIDFNIRQGLFTTLNEISHSEGTFSIQSEVDTHIHGIDLLHNIYEISKALSIDYERSLTVLNKLFKKGFSKKYNIFSFSVKEFYAFIINNIRLILEDFKEATRQIVITRRLFVQPKELKILFPVNERIKYDSKSTSRRLINSNVYENYTEEMLVEGLKSKSERLFEHYCESNKSIEWLYKNGDSGEDYLSIVYQDSIGKQYLFFPDYIVKMYDGSVWIIETKGGEYNGESKNIDLKSGLKFYSLKEYAKKHKLNWGFVRDTNDLLYLNNSSYTEEMNNKYWVDIRDVF